MCTQRRMRLTWSSILSNVFRSTLLPEICSITPEAQSLSVLDATISEPKAPKGATCELRDGAVQSVLLNRTRFLVNDEGKTCAKLARARRRKNCWSMWHIHENTDAATSTLAYKLYGLAVLKAGFQHNNVH